MGVLDDAEGNMLIIVPLELQDANELVTRWHRHHEKVIGHRFSSGALDVRENRLVGAAIVSRPVARMTDQRTTVEITRLVTDGTRNACSIMYAACARIARELGYQKIQTFILESEPGISLRAAGWTCEDAHAGGGAWAREDRPRDDSHPLCMKQRWTKDLNPARDPSYLDTLEGRRRKDDQATLDL
jgi:hypothetical protein